MKEMVKHIARAEFSRRAEKERKKRFEVKQRRETHKERRERLEEELAEFADMVSLATASQISEFEARLETYETATVEALLENELKLEEVRSEIDDMLEKAHVLQDGHRVFKTRDGIRVFDEHGVELKKAEIDANNIDDNRPRWEAFKAARKHESQLVEERKELLEYQDKLDAARKRLDDDDLTSQELDDLGTELDAAMPESVKAKLGLEKATNLAIKSSFNVSATSDSARQPVRLGLELSQPGWS